MSPTATPALTLLDGVRWRGEAVAGDRGHALLACLALARAHTVTVGGLVEALWPDERPDHPEKALQVLVSRTRARTATDVVTHIGGGYRLGLRDDEVDLLQLHRLVAEAHAAFRAGDLDVARLAALDALAVPVGSAPESGPLADVHDEARSARSRAELLLGRALLARGEADGAFPRLAAAWDRAPGDEDVLADLLRAEAAARGVPAALARYAAYADQVRDELGAEPGALLRRLHLELLAQDAPVRQGLKYDAAPMVGRDDDVAAIRGLLDRSRVVSIVGPGGLGKTRMANLVGRLALQPVVHLVELAGVTAAEGVLTEVGNALGVRESVTSVRTAQLRSDLRARIAEQLDGPPTLLVLDNCEHLLDAVADLVAFLVATTDSTSVLTTSRAPLGLAAEQVYLLPQLAIADAVDLFDQRARAARSGVHLDDTEVAALVQRLDGLPLAIELAAAKVRVMSVAEISRRLADRFALLAGRDRSAPQRHQTLEAVIAWSWNLLRAEDRAALRALSVFPDGFGMDGAAALLGEDPLASLAELVEQSLLVVREGQEMRYRFLETVREYGLKQLVEAGEEADVRSRLTQWAVGFARSCSFRMFGPEQITVVDLMRPEAGNLAGVMRAALEAGDVETVVPLVGALAGYWTIQGDHLTVLGITGPVLDLILDRPAATGEWLVEYRVVLAMLIVNATIFSGRAPDGALERLREVGLAGDHGRADAICRVLIEVYDDGAADNATLEALCHDDDSRVARVARQWATQAFENAGDLEGAIRCGRLALELARPDDGPWDQALLEAQLCGLASQEGDWDQSVHYARRALPVMQAVGALEDAVQLRSQIALADIAHGRLDEAARELDAISAEEGGEHGLGWKIAGLAGQAELALARGDVDRGLGLYLDCLAIARQRKIPGLEDRVPEMPWVVYAEASTLVAHVVHGRSGTGTPLALLLGEKLPVMLRTEPLALDFPIVGGAVLAIGLWSLAGTEPAPDADRAEVAVRLMALGHRFGYHRSLPTMAWDRLRPVADRAAPGVLERVLSEYAGHRSPDLVGEAEELLARLG